MRGSEYIGASRFLKSALNDNVCTKTPTMEPSGLNTALPLKPFCMRTLEIAIRGLESSSLGANIEVYPAPKCECDVLSSIELWIVSREINPTCTPKNNGSSERLGYCDSLSGSSTLVGSLSNDRKITISAAAEWYTTSALNKPSGRSTTGQSYRSRISRQQCHAESVWRASSTQPEPWLLPRLPLEPPPTLQFQTKCLLAADSNMVNILSDFLPNVKRMHPYQRGRAWITGFGL